MMCIEKCGKQEDGTEILVENEEVIPHFHKCHYC